MIEVTSEITERAPGIERMVEQTIARGQNATPMWQRLNHDTQREWYNAFASSGQSLGDAWEPLKEATVRARLRLRGANKDTTKVLWAYGNLRRSLVQKSADSIIVMTPSSFVRGTIDKKAATHHRGYPARGLPARPLITQLMLQRLSILAAERYHQYVVGGDAR